MLLRLGVSVMGPLTQRLGLIRVCLLGFPFSMDLGNVVGSIWFAFQGSCCVAQADLELRILLTQLPPLLGCLCHYD